MKINIPRVAITGNTYHVKDQIKALGGRWDGERKAWMVSAIKAGSAQRLVDRTYRRTGCECGSREGIPREGDCQICQNDE